MPWRRHQRAQTTYGFLAMKARCTLSGAVGRAVRGDGEPGTGWPLVSPTAMSQSVGNDAGHIPPQSLHIVLNAI